MTPPLITLAIIAALEREVSGYTEGSRKVSYTYDSRAYTFYELDGTVIICGGIGLTAARRAAEAVINLYHPATLLSVGFAGALTPRLNVGDIFEPASVIDARDGSRVELPGGTGTLITFMEVASSKQKLNLAHSYGAQAVDMEASAIAFAARAHGINFRVTKVISDDLDFEMPESARFIDAEGRFRTSRFAVYTALRPWIWARVAKLASNSRKAAKSLAEHLKDRRHLMNTVEAKIT